MKMSKIIFCLGRVGLEEKGWLWLGGEVGGVLGGILSSDILFLVGIGIWEFVVI